MIYFFKFVYILYNTFSFIGVEANQNKNERERFIPCLKFRNPTTNSCNYEVHSSTSKKDNILQ